jgi:hypothetical protein
VDWNERGESHVRTRTAPKTNHKINRLPLLS